MVQSYFSQLVAETQTRVWVNNPTIPEVGLALAAGAVGCTTNPAYGGNLLRRAPDEIRPIIADCVRMAPNDHTAADLVQQRLVRRIAEAFLPTFESTGGRAGFVSIQGDPEADGDAERILMEGREGRSILPNVTPKIPATAAGLEAFEVLVAEGHPTIVTEVFSLAQLVETAERYLTVTARTGVRPPFFMSPITGIFGDHLKALVASDSLDAEAHDLELAGVVLSRACQRLVEARDYPVTLLCGGARTPFDLTGLVGADLHATINWSTFAEVIASAEPFGRGIETTIDPLVVQRLTTTFEDVRRALEVDGLTVADFEAFPPVQHFRSVFVAGWRQVLDAIAAERGSLVAR